MDFKAEIVNGVVEVKAIVENDGTNCVVHVPSFKVIEQKKREYYAGNAKEQLKEIIKEVIVDMTKEQNGKRDI